jgi:hypothetical protein
LIQRGEILSVETPQKIIAAYPKKLYRTTSTNNFALLSQLRAHPSVETAFLFGGHLHVTFKTEADETVADLEEIEPTVEDCFIELMKREEQDKI